MVLDPVEYLTTALRRGQPFSEQAVTDMKHLMHRLHAFEEALQARLQEIEEVVEDEVD